MASIPAIAQQPELKDTQVEDSDVKEAPLPNEILSHLYSSMVKARTLARRFRSAPHNGEAVLAGLLQNTEPADLLVSAIAHPVLEGMLGDDVAAVVTTKKPNGNDNDTVASLGNSRVVAAGMDAAGVAAGLALALKRAQSPAIVVVVLPGKLTRGVAWYAATAFAAEQRLPMVFLADWTDARSSTRKHDGRDLSHWPFPTIAVDGRDVIAMFRVTREATAAARRGHGPTLVDCVNFLAPGTRGKDERDPIASFRGYLKRHNAWQE